MTAIFTDTLFYIALLARDDKAHDRAVAAAEARRGQFVTTEWVLTEVADAFSDPSHRSRFVQLLELLKADPDTEIVSASGSYFELGADLYASRSDKAWSLTDCISFVVMTERAISEALTGDHHFEQAGFRALLRDV
jgi:predicted nucleic acid-binding protein